jgi:hypothetical protein
MGDENFTLSCFIYMVRHFSGTWLVAVTSGDELNDVRGTIGAEHLKLWHGGGVFVAWMELELHGV